MSYRTLGLAASLLSLAESLARIPTPDGHLRQPVVDFSMRLLFLRMRP